MITIIHGDDIASSRKYLVEQKEKAKEPVSFQGDKVTITELVQVIDGGSLFGLEKSLFLENLLSKRSGKDLEEIKEYLKKSSLHPIYLWEEKEITKTNLNFFGKITQNLFKIPRNIFLFLDSIKPGNREQLIRKFHQSLKTVEAEFIFQMIIRQMRLLLAISEQSEKNIDEALRLADWQKSKLRKQASLFSKEKLIKLHSKLYEIDLEIKTGNLNLTTVQAIDMLLLGL